MRPSSAFINYNKAILGTEIFDTSGDGCTRRAKEMPVLVRTVEHDEGVGMIGDRHRGPRRSDEGGPVTGAEGRLGTVRKGKSVRSVSHQDNKSVGEHNRFRNSIAHTDSTVPINPDAAKKYIKFRIPIVRFLLSNFLVSFFFWQLTSD